MVTSSEPVLSKKKKKTKKKKQMMTGMMPMMPVFVMNPYMNMEPGQMPKFHPGKTGQVPYQLAFAPMAMQPPPKGKRNTTKKKSTVKNLKGHTVSFSSNVSLSPDPSTTNLQSQSNKMMTFSHLQQKQMRKTRSATAVVPADGSFTGHGSIDVNTVTKNSTVLKRGIMKKSASDSSTVGKSS